jgi:predicted O-methyltransferase YrrM
MAKKTPVQSVLNDPRAEAVLKRLHEAGDKEFKSLVFYYLKSLLRGRSISTSDPEDHKDFLRDKLVPLDPEKGNLCYLLCRALGAKRVVEVGTSFGASTIYLAAAIRDNMRASGEKGIAIGTEYEPTKAAAARRNFAEAGVSDFIDLREGDALETLKDAGGPVDFLLIDTWIPLTRPAIELMTPQLRPGAIVMCDNVRQFAKPYRAYTDFVRNPANGFRTMLLDDHGGTEFSVRMAD